MVLISETATEFVFGMRTTHARIDDGDMDAQGSRPGAGHLGRILTFFKLNSRFDIITASGVLLSRQAWYAAGG